MKNYVGNFNVRWVMVRTSPAEAKRIASQVRKVETRDANHRLKHHLHTERVLNCPDCKGA